MTAPSQRPRVLHVPKTTVYDLGTEITELAEFAGLSLFEWQKYAMKMAMGIKEDGTWSAFEVGLVVSRQNGKGSLLEARELAGLFLLDEKLIIHSAHQFDTSLEAFNRIKMLIENTPDLDRQVARMPHSHGEEGIELKNGQRLKFRTRTKGGGRGFSADCLILDEAMYLGSAAVAALMPTMSARSNPQMWYTGSAGDVDSVHLGSVRRRAIAGDDPALTYMEWSIEGCSEHCDPETRDFHCPDHDSVKSKKAWGIANPSMDVLIPSEHIAKEQRSMDMETFKRERLGIGSWPQPIEAWNLISEEAWMARASEVKKPLMPLTFAIYTTRDRGYSCIIAVGQDGEDGVCAEITSTPSEIDYRPGTGWVIPRVLELDRRWKPQGWIIDGASQAGAFKEKLEAAGVKVYMPSTREYAQWCGKMYTAIVPGRNNIPYLWHRGQEDLDNAVRGATKRNLAGLWALAAQNVSVDISPLECMALALGGHEKFSMEKKSSLSCAWG